MTSYGGIIRIRFMGRSTTCLSACSCKLPCFYLQIHYIARFAKKQYRNLHFAKKKTDQRTLIGVVHLQGLEPWTP